jgi:hypothetical protein
VIADRRKRGVQLGGGGPERSRDGDRAQRAEMLQVDALPIIRNGEILVVNLMLLRSLPEGTLHLVESLIALALMLLLAIAAQFAGVDSRTVDPNDKVRWFPGAPRD